MGIGKEDLHYGAALYRIAKARGFNAVNRIPRDLTPRGHFSVNGFKRILIRYRAGERRWYFQFDVEELSTLIRDNRGSNEGYLVLVCGDVGICLLDSDDLNTLLDLRNPSDQCITVERPRRGQFHVSGHAGRLLDNAVSQTRFPRDLLT